MLRVVTPNLSHSCNEGNMSGDFYQCHTVFLKAGVNYVWFVLLTHFICVFNYLLTIGYNNPWYIWNKIINDYRRFLLNKNSRMRLSQRQGGKKEHIKIKYNGYSEKYTWKEHLYQIAVILPNLLCENCRMIILPLPIISLWPCCFKYMLKALGFFFLPFALAGNVNAKFDFNVRCWIIFLFKCFQCLY